MRFLGLILISLCFNSCILNWFDEDSLRLQIDNQTDLSIDSLVVISSDHSQTQTLSAVAVAAHTKSVPVELKWKGEFEIGIFQNQKLESLGVQRFELGSFRLSIFKDSLGKIQSTLKEL